jgi:hypothetical protein
MPRPEAMTTNQKTKDETEGRKAAKVRPEGGH